MTGGGKAPMTQVPEIESWLSFFRARRDRALSIFPGPALDAEKRGLIARSIATFQLGESSDGAQLRAAAESFARKRGLRVLPEITDLFIREEQFHAALLGGFMESNGIPRLRSQWSDRVFRFLRRFAGFEEAIAVLLVAEIIALTYYRALQQATGSEALRRICETILADEKAHVSYESTLLLRFRVQRSPFLHLAARGIHCILFAGAVAVVFAGHRRVLRAGGYSWSSFRASCWSSFRDALGPASVPRRAPALAPSL
jgi:hypothetical protein